MGVAWKICCVVCRRFSVLARSLSSDALYWEGLGWEILSYAQENERGTWFIVERCWIFRISIIQWLITLVKSQEYIQIDKFTSDVSRTWDPVRHLWITNVITWLYVLLCKQGWSLDWFSVSNIKMRVLKLPDDFFKSLHIPQVTEDCILDLNLRGSANSKIRGRLDSQVLRQGSWILRWSRKIKNDIIFALGPQSSLLSLVVSNNSYIRFPSYIKDPNLHNAISLHVRFDGPTGLYSTISINFSLSKWRRETGWW
jgi:hypothetical protein